MVLDDKELDLGKHDVTLGTEFCLLCIVVDSHSYARLHHLMQLACLHHFQGVGDDVIVTSTSGSVQITRQGFQFTLAQFFVSSLSASSLELLASDKRQRPEGSHAVQRLQPPNSFSLCVPRFRMPLLCFTLFFIVVSTGHSAANTVPSVLHLTGS